MKTSIIKTTALMGFFSFAAATSASADLAPDDVPLLCVDICGPMVELSSICQIPVGPSSDELRKLKRREFIEAQIAESAITARAELATASAMAAASPTLTHSFKFVNGTKESGRESARESVSGVFTQTGLASASLASTHHRGNSTQKARTSLSTARFGNSTATHAGTSTTLFLNSTHTTTNSFRNSISATLTSSVFSNTTTTRTAAKTTTTTTSASTNSNDLPTIVESTNPLAVGNAAGTQNVDPGSSSVPAATESATESATASTSAVREGQLSGGDMKRVQAAEKDCVCSNDSFNVAKVAALCASCISQAGFPMGPAEYIVWNCSFTKQQWTRSQDKVANNVVVKAKTPQVTGVNGAERTASRGALAVMLSGVCALVLAL